MNKNKKKVLEVSFGGLSHGGVSSVIFSIVKELYKEFEFGCIVFNFHGDEEKRFEKIGKLHRIKCYSSDDKRNIVEFLTRPLKIFFGIYKICKKEKYEVIHAHNMGEEGICLFAAKCAGVKNRIAHSHQTKSDKKNTLLKKLYININKILVNKFATYKIGCSEQACKDYFGLNGTNVIYNSIDTNKFKYSEKNNKQNIKFIHVGRYCDAKNQEFIIKVFYNILSKRKDISLDLIGFGKDEEKLKDIINKYNLDKYVRLVPGDKIDVSEYYKNANYFIFPSKFEGFGIVLIEAQASGCYCFVSECIQKEADIGYLKKIPLEYGAEYWAEIIVDHINNEEHGDYNYMKRNLFKFSNKYIADEYRKLYKNIY